ncbi:hypothetical protein ATL41_1011 [Flavimobilis soli]|uniref:Pyrimidine dimer DNA glycosylase /DNA-(Apurinic or apyrimidinic site) lyase n=1 Tax=Flavimobilis soli TaxID=442709 RepID=A0A2A9EBN2_9MICO|nr:pyrimidine dimer DNA glycosylase/endonuclease V [Flavimobilis soli]PFG36294.1 hypothetical protein ATL41_1011 [Flavimobilis soli]
MRIWSLHPQHLDRQALIACWRETLLAQAVIAGRTRGYRNHPQLERFVATPQPIVYVGAYLAGLAVEADARGYRFDRTRIDELPADLAAFDGAMEVTTGQLALEWRHLLAKLDARSPDVAAVQRERVGDGVPGVHPMFRVVEGPVASWERAV